MNGFQSINKGYNSVFRPNEMSLGLVVPIEYYPVAKLPTMGDHLQKVQLAEKLGFKAIWLRDIPLNVPAFGDVGQMYDPLTYLAYMAGQTSEIALGVASIALPLHHPVHIAKQAATVDQLSDGRLILGVASGDRPDEYPAMGIDFESRGERFREAFQYVRAAGEDFPTLETTHFGNLDGTVDVLPKPIGKKIPMLLTGHSRQSIDWNAAHGDGWMYYLRNPKMQANTIADWREKV
ncbi:MAG: TIGR03571 family LLM class oxidoreductase, partial [Flavobacteriales bacterium]|nr:TIGR03571 family LLM class oxidoreductase [Flavobacteriales bacterium]